MQAKIIQGECQAVLKTLESDSFDSMVTDPPAGVSFMGAEWDTHTLDGFEDMLTAVFTEAYRVLKPGAHILVWSLPRTSYRTGMAIERAGFVMRDAIHNIKDRSSEVQAFLASLTPDQVELLVRAEPTDNMIGFCFGSGFPKSLSVSKAIDRPKGAEREVIGAAKGKGGQNLNQLARLSGADSDDAKSCGAYGVGATQIDIDIPITAPATPEAKQWNGFGTSLKPAIEIWWLARKPLKEKTVAEQVLATGTGALNIDACRISCSESITTHSRGKNQAYPKRPIETTVEESGRAVRQDLFESASRQGRWPANVVLSHSPSCRKVGTKQAGIKRSLTPGDRGGDTAIFGSANASGTTINRHCDAEGKETVDAYECVEGCPVKALDEQSGDSLSSGIGRKGASRARTRGLFGEMQQGPLYSDVGGASRYYQQFETSSQDETWDCAPGYPVKALDDSVGILTSGYTKPGQPRVASYGKGGYSGGFTTPTSLNGTYGDTGGASRFYQNFEPDPNAPPFFYGGKISTGERKSDLDEEGLINKHPTTKTIKLMSYLVKLITPPKGLVLDPFAGSGSTIVAAVQEGFSGVGIEREPEYHAIGTKRVAAMLERKQADQESQDLFDMAMGNKDE